MTKKKSETITEKIIRIMQDTEMEYNAKGMTIELKKRKVNTNPNSVRKIFSRLHKKGLIIKTETGFYKAKNTSKDDFKLIQKSGIEDMITYETKDVPKLHRVFFTFSPKKVREWLKKAGYEVRQQRDNQGAGGVMVDADLLTALTNPFSPDNLYQRYIATHTSKKLEESQSYQDTFTFTASSNREIIIQTYGTGAVNIILSASQDPLTPPDLLSALFSVDVIFQSIFGYSFITDLIDLFFITQIEFNRDEKTVEVIPQGEVITVRELEDWAFRYYTKEMEDGTYMREEYIFADGQKPPTASQFLLSLESAIQGGVNVQYLIYQTKQLYDAVSILQQTQEKIANATEYLLNENRVIMREIIDLKKNRRKKK